MKWVRRAILLLILLSLTILQVSVINERWPWLQLVFLFVLIFVAYSRSSGALGVVALGGFLSEAFAIKQSGLIFISFMVMALIMLIIEKTVLSRASIFSVGVLVLIGAVVFGLGMYLQSFVISSIFLSHPFEIQEPARMAIFYFSSVVATFVLHGFFKAGLDRFFPKTHRYIYGDSL